MSNNKTRGRFVCHILRIYIYLIESLPAVKRINLFNFSTLLYKYDKRLIKSFFFKNKIIFL